ncbi:MAG: carboxypeptidase-like regulatory domain-containing protein [Candidatus Zixiibacteriota bacterium]
MKRLCVVLGFVAAASAAAGVDLGVVSAADYIRFEIHALDTAGIPTPPDSGHILVWFEGETTTDAASYTNRWAAAGAGSVFVDSAQYAGHTYYYFVDQVGDIDNDEGQGLYSGVVMLYTDGGLPTPNRFTFTLAGDELSDYWAELKRVGDSINTHDDWVGRQAEIANINGWNPSSDSTHVNGLNAARLTRLDNLDEPISGLDDNPWDNTVRQLTALDEDVTVIDLNGTIVVPADTNQSGDRLAVMPEHWTAADSTAHQGAASGLDSADVARAVWNAPAANHTSSGTYGAYLDTAVSVFIIGSGAYSISVIAYDSANDLTVAGVRLAVRNLEQSSLLAAGATNSSGRAGFNLDAGSYLITATAPGYMFEAYDTISVTGGQTDTVRGVRFDPGAPSAPDLCRVYGYLLSTEGQAESGVAVTAWLPSGVTTLSGIIISPSSVATATDNYGYFYLDLVPSQLMTGGPLYEITISRADGAILRKRVSVPDQETWQLAW